MMLFANTKFSSSVGLERMYRLHDNFTKSPSITLSLFHFEHATWNLCIRKCTTTGFITVYFCLSLRSHAPDLTPAFLCLSVFIFLLTFWHMLCMYSLDLNRFHCYHNLVTFCWLICCSNKTNSPKAIKRQQRREMIIFWRWFLPMRPFASSSSMINRNWSTYVLKRLH